jgi:hypothetical protein
MTITHVHTFDAANIALVAVAFYAAVAIGRDEVGVEQMQSILDTMGLTALQILGDSYAYVTGLVEAFPDDLPAKYHEAPYDYEIDQYGQITLLSLKDAWQPEPEPETESNDD